MASNPPVPPAPPAPGAGGPVPAPKKTSPLVWILGGLGGCLVLVIICVVGVGLFVAHKAKQAGLDPDLIKRNPALAAVKLAVAANPDVDLVSTDEGRQQITIREKKTGKTYTMSFDDAKKGKFTFKEDGKEAVTISGANGTVEMKSAEGTVRIGGNAKVPTWVPDYPSSQPQGAFSAQGKDGEGGTFTFKTRDSSDKVVSYYQDQFKSLGMKVTSNITTQNGQSSAGMLIGQDEANKHTVTVVIGTEGGETTVGVTYATNK